MTTSTSHIKNKLKNYKRYLSYGAPIAFVLIFGAIGYHLLFSGHAATPGLAQTVPVCGERQPSDDEEYNGTVPATSNLSTVAVNNPNGSGGSPVKDFVFLAGSGPRPDEWYVRDQGTSTSQDTFRIYNASNNSLISTFYVPQTGKDRDLYTQNFAVDSSGNIYFVTNDVLMSNGSTNGQQGKTLYKYTPATSGLATQDWSQALLSSPGVSSGPAAYAVYSYTSSSGQFTIGAVTTAPNSWNPNGSELFNTAGANIGFNSIVGTDINQNPTTGDIVSAENVGGNATVADNVIIYNSAGTQTFSMGAPLVNSQPGPFHFQGLDAAAELPNGDIVVADNGQNVGLEYFSNTGNYIGLIQNSAAQPNYYVDNVQFDTNLVLYNGSIYYSGTNGLESISLSTAQTAIGLPQGAPFQMGIGAGVFTKVTNNYFPSGTTPAVYLEFYQWWQAQAANFTGSYSVRNIQQILSGQPGTPVSFSIPGLNDSSAYNNGVADLPINLPSIAPGVYEVNATLTRNGSVVGASCVVYTVGAANDNFSDPSVSMPSAGPDTQGVALAAEFGQKLFRSNYTMANCLQNATSLTSSTQLTCPANMVSDVAAAAQLAANDGMIYEIQLVGGGGYNLAESGLSNQQFGRMAGLMASQFPEVKDWEVWNEPDNNYFGNEGSAYVDQALQPAYAAIKNFSSSDQVIGFSSNGYDVGALQNFVQSNGLQYSDMVAIHSYTGWNKSFEEQGNIIPTIYNPTGDPTGQIQQDQTYLSSVGYNGPLLDTESGFTQNGGHNEPDPYDYYSQGDKQVRKMILEQSIGMNWLSNFYNDGSFSVGGAYSALLGGSQGNTLNPGGLADVNYEANLGGRSFGSWLTTGVPHTYAAQYGSSASSNSNVVAVWSDDYSVNVVPKLSSGGAITVTSEYGAISTLQSGQPLTLTGQVQYLTVPNGTTLSVGPQETYGANYALPATATVSSSSNFEGNPFDKQYGGSSSSCTSSNPANPQVVLSGIADDNGSNFICNGTLGTMWSPDLYSNTDSDPSLTITLKSPQTIDRVFVSSQSIGSSVTGLRNYTVEVNNGSGTFTTVASATNLFFNRSDLLSFAPQTVSQIKLTNFAINYTGAGNGLPPTWWNSSHPLLAAIYDVEAYGPGSGTQIPPQAPTGVNAVATSPTSVSLNWTASVDSNGIVAGYYILRTGPGNTQTTFNQQGTATTYTDNTVSPNTSYTYTVEAYDTNQLVSVPSSPPQPVTTPSVAQPPNAPISLSGSAKSDSEIDLSWQPASSGPSATGYYVLRANGSGSGIGSYTNLDPSGTTNLSYQDTNGLQVNSTYSYVVEAYNSSGVSAYSPVAVINTPPQQGPPPSQPTNLKAEVSSSSQINLHWNSSSSTIGIAGYNIYRNNGGTSAINTTTPINPVLDQNTTYGDTNLSSSTKYSYEVMAVDTARQTSPLSKKVNATTLSTSTTTGLTGTVTNTKNNDLDGVMVYGEKTNTSTNTSGVYYLVGLNTGEHYFYYALPNYNTASPFLNIKPNVILTKDVNLKKI